MVTATDRLHLLTEVLSAQERASDRMTIRAGSYLFASSALVAVFAGVLFTSPDPLPTRLVVGALAVATPFALVLIMYYLVQRPSDFLSLPSPHEIIEYDDGFEEAIREAFETNVKLITSDQARNGTMLRLIVVQSVMLVFFLAVEVGHRL